MRCGLYYKMYLSLAVQEPCTWPSRFCTLFIYLNVRHNQPNLNPKP